jgi:hypothetical protein
VPTLQGIRDSLDAYVSSWLPDPLASAMHANPIAFWATTILGLVVIGVLWALQGAAVDRLQGWINQTLDALGVPPVIGETAVQLVTHPTAVAILAFGGFVVAAYLGAPPLVAALCFVLVPISSFGVTKAAIVVFRLGPADVALRQAGGRQRGERLAELLRKGDALQARFHESPQGKWLDHEAAKAEKRAPRVTPEFKELYQAVMSWHAEVIESVRVEISEVAAATVEVVFLHLPSGKVRLAKPGELPESGSRDPYYLEGFVRALVTNLRDHLMRFDPVSGILHPGAPPPAPRAARRPERVEVGQSWFDRRREEMKEWSERAARERRAATLRRLTQLRDAGHEMLTLLRDRLHAPRNRQAQQAAQWLRNEIVELADHVAPGKGAALDSPFLVDAGGRESRNPSPGVPPIGNDELDLYLTNLLRRLDRFLDDA